MSKLIKNLNLKDKKLIVLIGHMGSGKSTIGKILARELNWNFFDSDKEIEKKENMSINQIFTEKSESYFRNLEKKYIIKLMQNKNTVIALGGGSIKISKIRKFVEKEAISIFLKVDIKTLLKRLLNNKNRPLLINTNIEKKIKVLDSERYELYRNANIILENTKSKKEIIDQILRILNNEKR